MSVPHNVCKYSCSFCLRRMDEWMLCRALRKSGVGGGGDLHNYLAAKETLSGRFMVRLHLSMLRGTLSFFLQNVCAWW